MLKLNNSGNTMKSIFFSILTVGVILTAVLFLSGCSPQERRGISPIPHNRPAAWEYNSFAR
ncbi:MAG: hypothetical protein IKA22_02120 [Lentisphaeria bacterium]|nr:hypothetical protein [Lentisphaeria bacterium]